jgi:transcription elongation factor Elf1
VTADLAVCCPRCGSITIAQTTSITTDAFSAVERECGACGLHDRCSSASPRVSDHPGLASAFREFVAQLRTAEAAVEHGDDG